MPKTEVFHFFLKTAHWNFLIFCTKSSLWSEKMPVSLFCEKVKNDPFWPKFRHFGRQKFNFFPFFFTKIEKKLFRAKKTHFSPFLPTLWPPSPTQILFIFCFFPKICKKVFLAKNYVTLGLKWFTFIGPRMTACFW